MNAFSYTLMASKLGISPVTAGIFIGIVVLWSVFWKGWALWISARGSHKVWFVVFLLLNTLGILEIIYIYFISKRADRTPNA